VFHLNKPAAVFAVSVISHKQLQLHISTAHSYQYVVEFCRGVKDFGANVSDKTAAESSSKLSSFLYRTARPQIS
jgi:hypothetical protein